MPNTPHHSSGKGQHGGVSHTPHATPRAAPSHPRTSRSGNVSLRRETVRCERPLGLKASSAVGVFSSSGVLGKMTT